MVSNTISNKERPDYYNGCPMCGRPVLEDHTLCTECECKDMFVYPPLPEVLQKVTAKIYEFPSGKVLTSNSK